MKSCMLFPIAILMYIARSAKSSRTFGRVCNFNMLIRNIAGCPSGSVEEITQAECERNENCCFDDTVPSATRCFQNPTSPVSSMVTKILSNLCMA